MWVFLLTEVLFFGGLFCAYAIYRAWNPDMFLTLTKRWTGGWRAEHHRAHNQLGDDGAGHSRFPDEPASVSAAAC